MNVKSSRTPYRGVFNREPKSRCWDGEEREEETLAGQVRIALVVLGLGGDEGRIGGN